MLLFKISWTKERVFFGRRTDCWSCFHKAAQWVCDNLCSLWPVVLSALWDTPEDDEERWHRHWRGDTKNRSSPYFQPHFSCLFFRQEDWNDIIIILGLHIEASKKDTVKFFCHKCLLCIMLILDAKSRGNAKLLRTRGLRVKMPLLPLPRYKDRSCLYGWTSSSIKGSKNIIIHIKSFAHYLSYIRSAINVSY